MRGAPGRWSGFEAVKVSRFHASAFPRPIQLRANQTSLITLRSTGGSHVIPGVRDGSVSTNYFGQSTTVEGEASYGNAASNQWTAWELGWKRPYSTAGHFDISFYLEKQRSSTPTLSLADTRVDESTGQARIALSLSQSASDVVSVLVHTRVGTARGGSDYYGWTQTVEFQPGVTRKSVTVTILNDSEKEPTENFSIHLLSPVNATVNDGVGIVTIVDDD